MSIEGRWSGRTALAVVGAGGQEVEQHVVLVGSHHEVLDRQTEQLGIVAGEDIAEVAGRDHKLDSSPTLITWSASSWA